LSNSYHDTLGKNDNARRIDIQHHACIANRPTALSTNSYCWRIVPRLGGLPIHQAQSLLICPEVLMRHSVSQCSTGRTASLNSD
jgi:hypothetical protein